WPPAGCQRQPARAKLKPTSTWGHHNKIIMQIHIFLLDLFASIALISATMVIVASNPIHSVAFLTLVFCNATGLLILLGIEFLALMFIIIYVGAIAVLFLFVVMMLNIKVNELREN